MVDYDVQTWANGVLGGTPIDADALNHIEAGLQLFEDAINALNGAITDLSEQVNDLDLSLDPASNAETAAGVNGSKYIVPSGLAYALLNALYTPHTREVRVVWTGTAWPTLPTLPSGGYYFFESVDDELAEAPVSITARDRWLPYSVAAALAAIGP